jgi:hypothetical protein
MKKYVFMQNIMLTFCASPRANYVSFEKTFKNSKLIFLRSGRNCLLECGKHLVWK